MPEVKKDRSRIQFDASDAVNNDAAQHFGVEQLVLIRVSSVTINAWNRISAASRTLVIARTRRQVALS